MTVKLVHGNKHFVNNKQLDRVNQYSERKEPDSSVMVDKSCVRLRSKFYEYVGGTNNFKGTILGQLLS